MRRYWVLVLSLPLVLAAVVAGSQPVIAQKRQRVELPDGTVLSTGSRPVVSLDGSVGFVAPAVGDTLVAFAIRTGDVLGRLEGLGNASAITLHESGSHRIIVATFVGDPATSTPSVVVVIEASDPTALAARAIFRLPENLRIAPGSKAEVARGERFGVVPISEPVAALISFDLETGDQVGALTLDGTPDSLTIAEQSGQSNIAIVSSASNKIALVSLSDAGVLLPLSTFAPPDDAPVSATNNVAFDGAGSIGYVASLRGRALLSFSVESGQLIDRLGTDGSSAGLAVYHTPTSEILAVTNVSKPGGQAEESVAPKSDEQPLGLPGAVVVDAEASGKLAERARFYPDTGEEVVPSNNPEFSADGSSIFVPARTGSLYVVDARTGKSQSREGLDNRIQSIAAAPLAEAVAVLSAGGSTGHIDIVPTTVSNVDAPSSGDDASAVEAAKADKGKASEESKRDSGPPVIARLGPASVQSGRRRDLPVTVIGSGFTQGATVVIADTQYSAAVGPGGKRANFTLPSTLLANAGSIPVQIRNADGSLSNAVSLEVVTPFAPLVTSVRPKKLYTGNDGVDLKIFGDHFRDGAVANISYTAEDGTNQSVDLKTYRLSFTSIVARLPQKLTNRARQLSLTITDRDGATASAPESVPVVGPEVTKITPERLVAGDVDGSDALVLHVAGANFHPDVVVFVKRPTRGATDDGTAFTAVPSGSVVWKDSEKITVKLKGGDVAFSGDLVVRIVNPIAGQKRKNGDAADTKVVVAGPAIASSAPSVIIAGADSFVLKLTGTDFRRSAIVKISRDDGGGEGTKRVAVVDDPNFKDRKQINVEINTPQLLRLVARPGLLNVRVINGNGAGGDPSPPLALDVVAPGILEAPTLSASEDDPNAYKLKIKGQYFREGATAQIYDVNNTPVGKPLPTRFKDDTQLVVFIGRARVTELRTFQIVIINPGGTYNGSGVSSNAQTVTAN